MGARDNLQLLRKIALRCCNIKSLLSVLGLDDDDDAAAVVEKRGEAGSCIICVTPPPLMHRSLRLVLL